MSNEINTPTLTLLPSVFEGKGEVKGNTFKLIERSDTALLYERKDEWGTLYYEVFKRKIVNKYDFENQVALEDTKEVYPKSNNFGDGAWCFSDLKKAKLKFEELTNEL